MATSRRTASPTGPRSATSRPSRSLDSSSQQLDRVTGSQTEQLVEVAVVEGTDAGPTEAEKQKITNDKVSMENSLQQIFLCSLGLLVASAAFAAKPTVSVLLAAAVPLPVALLVSAFFEIRRYVGFSKCHVIVSLVFDLANKGAFAADFYFLRSLYRREASLSTALIIVLGQIVVFLIFFILVKRSTENPIVDYD